MKGLLIKTDKTNFCYSLMDCRRRITVNAQSALMALCKGADCPMKARTCWETSCSDTTFACHCFEMLLSIIRIKSLRCHFGFPRHGVTTQA